MKKEELEKIINQGGKVGKPSLDRDELIIQVARFVTRHKKFPKVSEFTSTNDLPSWASVYKYFGNMANLKQEVFNYLNDK